MGYSKFIEESLERQRLDFEKTRNPLIPWRARRMARGFRQNAADLSMPVPEWIERAFDDVDERLERISEDAQSPGFDWHSAIVQSFGFQASSRGGPSNPFRVVARNADQYRFAVEMRVLIDGDGRQATYAADEVAERWHVSTSTVLRAWRQYASIARTEDLERQIGMLIGQDLFSKLFGQRGLAYYGKVNIADVLQQLTASELLQVLSNNELEGWW